jgi:hypothetical protein
MRSRYGVRRLAAALARLDLPPRPARAGASSRTPGGPLGSDRFRALEGALGNPPAPVLWDIPRSSPRQRTCPGRPGDGTRRGGEGVSPRRVRGAQCRVGWHEVLRAGGVTLHANASNVRRAVLRGRGASWLVLKLRPHSQNLGMMPHEHGVPPVADGRGPARSGSVESRLGLTPPPSLGQRHQPTEQADSHERQPEEQSPAVRVEMGGLHLGGDENRAREDDHGCRQRSHRLSPFRIEIDRLRHPPRASPPSV